LQQEIKSELGAFAAILEAFEIPDHLKDSRSGTQAWQHPDLLEKIESTKPETKLAELLASSIAGRSDLWTDLPCVLTATEVESRLAEGSTRAQSGKLFTWQAACGTYLSKLAKSDCHFIQEADPDRHTKAKRYHISKP
jgi:hypothetical protein